MSRLERIEPEISLRDIPPVPREVYLERQARARQLAKHKGLAGFFCWVRGNGTYDRFASLMYLANHIPVSTYRTPDAVNYVGHGSSHAALWLPVEGDVVLFVDKPEHEMSNHLFVADRVVRSPGDLLEAMLPALDEVLPSKGEIGLVGSDVIMAPWYARFPAELRDRWRVTEDAIDVLQQVKVEDELRMSRLAASVASHAMRAVLAAAVPGTTEVSAMGEGYERIIRAGAQIYYASASSGPRQLSLRPDSTLAGTMQMKTGDLAAFEFEIGLEGYVGKIMATTCLGGEPTAEQAEVLAGLDVILQAGVAAAGPGSTAGDIAAACDAASAAQPWATRADTIRPRNWGHGLGMGIGLPEIVTTSRDPLMPGTILFLCAQLAVPGIGRVAKSVEILITETGNELLE